MQCNAPIKNCKDVNPSTDTTLPCTNWFLEKRKETMRKHKWQKKKKTRIPQQECSANMQHNFILVF
jgi:hypothetical protein